MPNGTRLATWRTSSDSDFTHMSDLSQPDHVAHSIMMSESDFTEGPSSVLNPYVAGTIITVDPEYERKTIAKVDRSLVPVLGLLYTWSYVNYSILPNLRVDGLSEEDLGLSHRERYNLANFVFWAPFIALQLPSVLALRRVGVAKWLGTLTFLLGALMVTTAFINDWQQLVAFRVCIGVLEAGLLPSSLLLMSCWYTRRELPMRMAFFYYLSVFISSFWGFISYEFSRLHVRRGPRPMNGWRWIPIVPGVFTVATSIVVFSTIIDFPDKNKHLTREETTIMQQRVHLDRGDAVYDPLTWETFWEYLKDWKHWAYGYLFMSSIIAISTPRFFYPFILPNVTELSSAQIRILLAPWGVFACIYGLCMAWLSQRTNLRSPFIALNTLISICGLCMVTFSEASGARFSGGFLTVAGSHGNIVLTLIHLANNVRTQSRRVFSSAFVCSFGGIGALVSQLIFDDKFAPSFTAGSWLAIACQVGSLVVVATLTAWFIRSNRKAPSVTVVEGGESKEPFTYTL